MAVDKNTVVKEAQKFAAKGQYDKAIAEWKKLLKDSPRDANLYNTIGDLCLKKNAKPEAVDAYKRAADILAEDGFTSKAIALYKKVLNIDPAKVEVHLALADMNADKGLIGNALESYKIVADHYKKQNKMDKALGIYQKMADLNPSNVAFRLKLAEMYSKQGLQNEAVKAYLDAADVHVSQNAFQDARQTFEKVLAIEPTNKQVYHKAGIVYFKEGKYIEACKALKPVFDNDPANQELAGIYIDALTKAGKGHDAEPVIKKILGEDPSRLDLQEKLFQIYLEKQEYDKALETASALSNASVEKGDHDGAVEIFKKFIAASPHYSPGRRKLGELYASLNRGQDAADTFLQMAEILTDEDDRDGAKAALTRALKIVPDREEAKELLKRLETSAITPPSPPEPQESEPPGATAAAPVFTPVVEEPAAAFEAPVFSAEAPAFAAPAAGPQAGQTPAPEEEDPAITAACTEIDVLVKYGLATKALQQLESLARRFPASIQVRIKLRDIYGDLGQMSKAAGHMLVLADLYDMRGMQEQAQGVLRSALAIDPTNAGVKARLGIVPASAAPVTPATPAKIAATKDLVTETPGPAGPPREEAGFPETQAYETEPVQQEPEAPFHNATSRVQRPEPSAGLAPDAHERLPRNVQGAGGLQAAGFTPEPVQPVSDESSPAFEESAPFHEPAPTDERAIEGLDAGITPGEETAVAETASDAPMLETAYESGPVVEEASPPAEIPMVEIDQHPIIEEASSFGEQPEAPRILKKSAGGQTRPQAPLAREPVTDGEISEIWAEAEFYYQQGLFDEAKKHYAKIIELNPGERRAIERLAEISREEEDTKEFTKLAEAVEDMEGALSAGPAEQELPLSASDQEAVRSLMNDIARLKLPKEKAAPPAPVKPAVADRAAPLSRRKAATPRQPSPPRIEQEEAAASFSSVGGSAEEDFFDLGAELAAESRASVPGVNPSEDFFDLASELKDELSGTAVPARPVAAEEQSLDEIFEEFKRGVEQQSTKEDADTHYNLGVAYKEMGLLDDAIEEFGLTPEGEPKFVQSRYMLGLCYMEKGEYDNAIGELENALSYSQSTGEDEQSRIRIHYDLGLAYQGARNVNSALGQFQKVQNINPGYRDIKAKLKELKQGDYISLDRLKDDIEKEISAKFLEEGERIEREEKNRKNEKIRK